MTKTQQRPLVPARPPAPAPVQDIEDLVAVTDWSAALVEPEYTPMSAWIEHQPFAFWLIDALRPRSFVELGTHWGASYFAFCQAVRQFDTNTACYAVDTWQGDEQAGFYGDEVFNKVRDKNRRLYNGFSCLIRNTFEGALPYFEDASIDLLHIDGLHTYHAVATDFETWLPKLSNRAVVLFHDTNVREREFGVFRFFAELRARYPTFEFLHGHGLGVVGVGTSLPPGVERLFDSATDDVQTQTTRRVFSRLGANCQDRLSLTKLEAETVRLEGVIASERAKITGLEARLQIQEESHAGAIARQQEAHTVAISRQQEAHAGAIGEQRAIVSGLEADIAAQRGLVSAAQTESSGLKAAIEEASRLAASLRPADPKQADRKQPGSPQELLGLIRALGADLVAQRKLNDDLSAQRRKDDEARDKSARLESDNQRLNKELGELTRRLVQGTQDIKRTKQLGADSIATLARLATVQQNARELIKAFAPQQPSGMQAALTPSIKALIRRLRNSGLVDEAWYLRNNDDVKQAGLDAARHYALRGAAEGRLPRDMSKPVN